jgi:NADP-dependent 3-hydroxy acid dehydrogenase YdfG
VTARALAGQVAVVAGATSAVGRSLCLGLADAGARLCLLGRDVDALQALAKHAGGPAGRVGVYRLDLTSDATLGELRDRLGRELDGIDILVLSAGVFEMAPHASAAAEDLDRLYRTNVRGPYLLIQAVLPLLRARRGQVVFMNSTVGLESRSGVGQYAFTQHGLRAIADTLRAEVNGDGVRVLTVYLGRTATERQRRIFALEGRPYAPEALIQPDDVTRMVMAALGLPRTAEVTEIRMRPLVKSY